MLNVFLRSGLWGPFLFLEATIIVAVAVLGVSRSRSPIGRWLGVGSIAASAWVFLVGMYGAWRGSVVDVGAVSGESLDPLARERILVESFHASDPCAMVALWLGIGALLISTALSIAAAARRGKVPFAFVEAAVAAVVALLVVPTSRLAHREERVHAAVLAKALDPANLSRESCLDLEVALDVAANVEEAERYLPDVRERAHSCVASTLSCLDRGGDCLSALRDRVSIRSALRPGTPSTPLSMLAQSKLLIDPAQKADVAARMRHDATGDGAKTAL